MNRRIDLNLLVLLIAIVMMVAWIFGCTDSSCQQWGTCYVLHPNPVEAPSVVVADDPGPSLPVPTTERSLLGLPLYDPLPPPRPIVVVPPHIPVPYVAQPEHCITKFGYGDRYAVTTCGGP